jgi:hypothetical protein
MYVVAYSALKTKIIFTVSKSVPAYFNASVVVVNAAVLGSLSA